MSLIDQETAGAADDYSADIGTCLDHTAPLIGKSLILGSAAVIGGLQQPEGLTTPSAVSKGGSRSADVGDGKLLLAAVWHLQACLVSPLGSQRSSTTAVMVPNTITWLASENISQQGEHLLPGYQFCSGKDVGSMRLNVLSR